jgi:predicted transcriptional regulator
MSTAVSIELPVGLAKRLDRIAGVTARSRKIHLQRAVKSYVEEIEDLRIAKRRMLDTKEPVVSLEEARKSLGL